MSSHALFVIVLIVPLYALLLVALGTGGALGSAGDAPTPLKLAHRATSIGGTLLAVVLLILLW